MNVPITFTALKENINFVMIQRVLFTVTVSQDLKSDQIWWIIHVKV
jgi:hypothetical protein